VSVTVSGSLPVAHTYVADEHGVIGDVSPVQSVAEHHGQCIDFSGKNVDGEPISVEFVFH
jgi:hypothetical protein